MPAKPRPGRKLTAEGLTRVRGFLDQGPSVPEISRATGVLANTIDKAIRCRRRWQDAKKKTRRTVC